ncbi:MAG: hypothetical protein Q8Q23_02740 [bacterium]|nr:hypothetical protein [bacterium]
MNRRKKVRKWTLLSLLGFILFLTNFILGSYWQSWEKIYPAGAICALAFWFVSFLMITRSIYALPNDIAK